MTAWPSRMRKRVFRNSVPYAVARYPLEIGLVVWAILAAINVFSGVAPSVALEALPYSLEMLWVFLMGVSATTVSVGMLIDRLAVIASGMYLFATVLAAYSFAIIGANGATRGGAVAGFFGIMGAVCLLRGWWLREQESALIKEIDRTQREEN